MVGVLWGVLRHLDGRLCYCHLLRNMYTFKRVVCFKCATYVVVDLCYYYHNGAAEVIYYKLIEIDVLIIATFIINCAKNLIICAAQ